MSDTSEMLGLIPAAQREVARAAIVAAFGRIEPSGLRPIMGGASPALKYAFEAGERSYLIRLEASANPMRNPHQYACMQIAAEAGVAPPLRHVDGAAGVAIMDLLKTRPLSEYPGGGVALARAIGDLTARLQATPLFPTLADYPAVLARMLGFIRSSGLFAPGLLDPHVEGFARIQAALPWDAASLVSSHNDPNPGNILFDGTRLWLIDWETAYRNDPLVDIAIHADNFARTAEHESALLQSWLGREPDRVLRARLVLVRQLTRLYYAALVLMPRAAVRQGEPDPSLVAPAPDEFRAQIAAGTLKPGSPDGMYMLGKIYLAGFLSGLSAPEFEEALKVLA